MEDEAILNGLTGGGDQRPHFEKELYRKYEYYINEGCREHNISYDDSFSAYSDAVMSAIHNILNNSFNREASLKTYLYRIFSNKCIDIIRRNTTIKEKVNKSTAQPELLQQLPDNAKIAIEKLIDGEKVQAIKKCLELIGEKCKKLLLLFRDGYTDKEIAEKLDYNSPSVAKITRFRCLERIKEKIKGV